MKHLNPLNPVEICSWNEKKKHKKKLNRGVSDVASGVLCITPVPIIISGSRGRDGSSTFLITTKYGATSLFQPTNFSENRNLDFQISRRTWEDLIRVISDEPDLSVPNEQKFHLMVHLFENDNL